MGLNININLQYFLIGLFLSWVLIYSKHPEPPIYELEKEKFENKCF